MRSDISRLVFRNVASSCASIWCFFHPAVVDCSLSLVLMTGDETGSVYRESLSQDYKQQSGCRAIHTIRNGCAECAFRGQRVRVGVSQK